MSTARNYSKKREAVLAAVRSTKCHPGARWIYEQVKPKLPDISLGTVYRNIKVCREEGLLASVGVVNNEERFDGIVEPHQHAICTKCGSIMDVEGVAPSGQPSLSGFAVDNRRTVFYGICAKCGGQEKNWLKKFKGFGHLAGRFGKN
ncbi:MAG: transcriptional repressor [Candidatus Margulisbacteria bacterium]|jgi:Fur family peroxide stress response transcriptional regulator|nr:transcriptional repressor [Candidatus Margulisiibacteriota bacterium]